MDDLTMIYSSLKEVMSEEDLEEYPGDLDYVPETSRTQGRRRRRRNPSTQPSRKGRQTDWIPPTSAQLRQADQRRDADDALVEDMLDLLHAIPTRPHSRRSRSGSKGGNR